MTPKTHYSFLTGILVALALDWTAQGPTYRRWRYRGGHGHEIGMAVGFALMLSLISGAFVFGLWWYNLAAFLLIAVALLLEVGANVVAAKLP